MSSGTDVTKSVLEAKRPFIFVLPDKWMVIPHYSQVTLGFGHSDLKLNRLPVSITTAAQKSDPGALMKVTQI